MLVKSRIHCVLFLFTIAGLLLSCSPTATISPSTPTPISTQTSVPTQSSTSIPIPIVNRTTTGEMQLNETWRGEILITGDIHIPSGVTLTIEPGTIVRFTGQEDDSSHNPGDLIDTAEYNIFPHDPPRIAAKMIAIIISGELKAVGTEEKPIVFTSNRAKPALNDWHSIILVENGKLELSYAIIEYNYTGVDFVNVQNPSVSLHGNLFRHIAGCCICTGGGSPILNQITIERNTFTDCNHEGIDTYKNQNILIRNNLFEDNVVGIVAINGSTVDIESNIFKRNRRWAIGIYNNSSPIIHENNFLDNPLNISIDNSILKVDATNNYWGSANPHPGGKGYVDYKPFASTLFNIPAPVQLTFPK